MSSKSLRHFALCCGGDALSFQHFTTGLGLCAIYVYREHQEAWSTREKVATLLASLASIPHAPPAPWPAPWPDLRAPEAYIGPRAEGFLWRLFEHFGQRKDGGLTNWGWAKLVRELKVDAPTHPDVLFNKHAAKGRLPFENFVVAVTEFDRLARGMPKGVSSRRVLDGRSDQENSTPFKSLASNWQVGFQSSWSSTTGRRK